MNASPNQAVANFFIESPWFFLNKAMMMMAPTVGSHVTMERMWRLFISLCYQLLWSMRPGYRVVIAKNPLIIFRMSAPKNMATAATNPNTITSA